MKRYWFEFDLGGCESPPLGISRGCGVTAQSQGDAIKIIQEKVFFGRDLPPLTAVVEDVDVATLDEGHVRPNMGNPVTPGVWFPLGY